MWSLASNGEHRPQLLCSGAWDHKVKVWDVTVGKEVANIKYVCLSLSSPIVRYTCQAICYCGILKLLYIFIVLLIL